MDALSEALSKNPIVIDNGSGYIKAGLAGEDRPQLIFPN
jgi:centractin